MKFYDLFYNNPHPKWIQKLLIGFNQNILSYLLTYFPQQKKISLLELGPGKGYFCQAARMLGKKISYSAFDRNDLILKSLNIKSIYKGEASQLSRFKNKFDIIYAAYLIEHLKNGEELH